MALLEYVVMVDGAKWKVRLEGVDYSPFNTIEEAIESALEKRLSGGEKWPQRVGGRAAPGRQLASNLDLWMDPYPPVWPSSIASLNSP